LLGGEALHLILWCLGIGVVVLTKIVLFRRQLEEFLFNGSNAVLRIEHLTEFFREDGHLLIQLRFLLRLHNPSRHVRILSSLCLQKMLLIGTTPQKSSQKREPLL